MQKILIIEDDRELNKGISYALGKAGYRTVSAYSLEQAEFSYREGEPDLILLDINLPDGEGFEFCRQVKKNSSTPVMFLTARDLERDALKGYDAGADDYVTKPFSINVLMKKVGVMLKRTEGSRPQIYDDGFLRVDFDAAKVRAGEAECILTPTEFRILRLFIENRGQLLTYSVLLERLWDSQGQFVDKHTLAVNMNRLRGKIEDGQHKYISNVYGMGYQWLK